MSATYFLIKYEPYMAKNTNKTEIDTWPQDFAIHSFALLNLAVTFL